jgi:hypothetical protein
VGNVPVNKAALRTAVGSQSQPTVCNDSALRHLATESDKSVMRAERIAGVPLLVCVEGLPCFLVR